MVEFSKTLHGIKADLAAGKYSSKDLVTAIYADIEQKDEAINAFITLNKEQALAAAEQADQIGYGSDAPVLNGIPLAIKDNILTEGLRTTAASKMLENFVPTYDATVIAKLKAAGAIIIGKVNMDEFAMGGSNQTSYFGPVHNPWDLERVPGGSSGGSAAVVASQQVPGALGTDTGGSVRNPAAFNGLVGMKPTYGTVSRLGVISFGSSLDQVGPLTHTVADNALLLEVIAGHDEGDSTSLPTEQYDFSSKIGQDLKGMKIAFPKEYKVDSINTEIRQRMQEAADFFESQGATVEEVSLPHSVYGINVYYIIASSEASSNLQRYDGIRYGYRSEAAQTLEEVYVQSRSEGFGDEVKRRIILGTFSLSAGAFDLYFKKAAQVRTLIKQEFQAVFDQYDLIMGPTTTSTAFLIGGKETKDPVEMYTADLLTVNSNLTGLPAISIPAGLDQAGLPIGLQLMAKAQDEATLYQVAHAFEQGHDYLSQEPNFVKGDK
ncbi:Asp-tRNA(Asn)/Glu-tRNA(Gln) amidotransferase subunit GatA [Eremococcus coleocola]|uniref:Glutamyl-tRNA(Gln) amidotransferase subunit A n=1 Tax=Eremococcus coleocola ACS-139-V-Col8 TaxID=908337 RepID=E4KPN3_9LACT|nr:Asp-tRNA(Asn)/Glu-tRNA(Gln) amidotransferase subunit GatA [Eremococcus coleocola]EFR31316.1 aspartyl/glutamyl-tRNA(Asn/Gln) amidotransferase, A subunit [Eremococcus coleocola ACS-139-V-Col8]